MARIQGKSSRARGKSAGSAGKASGAAPAKRRVHTYLAIPHAITRLFREQNRIYGQAVKALGISAEQAHLLMVLWTFGPRTMTELGREVALSSGTLSTAIDRMESAKLVQRIVDEEDRRNVRIEPLASQAGLGLKMEVADVLEVAQAEMLEPLNASERETLLTLLEKVLNGKAMREQADRKRR